MPVHGTPARDPRSIITPDAFEVSPALLGLPLARPMQRFWAILIDLAIIGIITLLTKSFALVLGVVAAVFFIRGGFKRTPVRGSVFGRAMRFSVGCLGLVIGIVTAIVWVSLGIGGRSDRRDDDTSERVVTATNASEALAMLRALGDVREFRQAADADAARTEAAELARRARALKMPDRDVRELLLGAVPRDAPWADDSALIVDEAMASGQEAPTPGEVRRAAEVAAYTPAEALEAYARLLREDADTLGVDAELRADLRQRLLGEIAADTLRILEEHVADLQALDDSRKETLDRLQESEERRGSSFFSWIGDIVNELGFGFGWASIYMTVMLSWWKGQTVGKRIMGIRVLRLDGDPITWWAAFERAGGYAAGFATGLLGFAQVYWDANRQAIHDRISGTVVVLDGAEKVLDWEEAL
jgi:uncharacterized RDD family membrane protein YckC